MRILGALAGLVVACELAAAATIPLPRPRPDASPGAAQSSPEPEEPPPPSACFQRLASKLAIATALPRVDGNGGCGAEDVVRLEAVLLPDKKRVAVTPPAVMRCSLAEAIANWVREDVAPAVRPLGSALQSVDNYASYDCRGRNRIIGARLSEHGKANALDMRSFKLANGKLLELTNPHGDKDFRERMKKTACVRFSTVLGPGSDGYHEDHVHVDLAERSSGYRICHWDVRDGNEAPAADAEVATVPLPRPRPEARVAR